MVNKIERTRNTNDSADTNDISLNSSTAVIVSPANDKRIFIQINNNNSAHSFWVRLYPANQDNVKHGIFVSSKTGMTPVWEMPADNFYTGEISAIAETDSPIAYVTEY